LLDSVKTRSQDFDDRQGSVGEQLDQATEGNRAENIGNITYHRKQAM
jgi:hypothetical protein